MKKAIYPGSFDPLTFGHMDIINRASRIVDELVVGVLNNSAKNSLFSLEERVNMLKNAGDGTAAWNIMFAGATISIVPILIVYCCFSRFFMGGLTAGAVKG